MILLIFVTNKQEELNKRKSVGSTSTCMPSLIQVGHCNFAGCSQPGVSQLRPSIAAQNRLSEASSQCRAPNLGTAFHSTMP